MSRILIKSKFTSFSRVQSLTNDDITVSKSLILSQNSLSLVLFIREQGHAGLTSEDTPKSPNLEIMSRHGREGEGQESVKGRDNNQKTKTN